MGTLGAEYAFLALLFGMAPPAVQHEHRAFGQILHTVVAAGAESGTGRATPGPVPADPAAVAAEADKVAASPAQAAQPGLALVDAPAR